MVTAPPLDGSLVSLPPLRHDHLDLIATEYERLLTTHSPADILVLKRHPEGLPALTEVLATVETPDKGPHRPQVEALPEHASKVVEEHDPQLERLEYEERIELISMVIGGTSTSLTPYLERARQQDSFVRDVGQLLLAATRQELGPADAEHPDLTVLYEINERYHAELERRGYVERPAIVPLAVDLLETNASGLTERVTDGFDAVLAVEFQEFRALDRRYLAALSAGSRLVCVGEPHASVERTRVEPGSLASIADGLEVCDREFPPTDGPAHATVARFLATGESPRSGRLHRLRAGTIREQDRGIAAEIQAVLDRSTGLSETDIAVAAPRIDRVPPLRSHLRAAGIPTDVIGTPALVANPAVHELYALATLQAGSRTDSMALDSGSAPRDRLRARVPDAESLLASCVDDRVRPSLQRWVTHSSLKRRIAEQADWVDAREQFRGVERVLDIAAFVESTDLVGPDWAGLERMLRRTIEFDAPYVHEASTPTGGVTVCPVDALAFDRYPVVFIADCTDRNYPGRPRLTELFPRPSIADMGGLPAVTHPTVAQLEETFAPAARDSCTGDPLTAYHAQRSRRRLALAARSASETLYCCTYERESGGLRRTHEQSRYLAMLEADPGVSMIEVERDRRTPPIHGRANGIEAMLETPRTAFDKLVRASRTADHSAFAEAEAAHQELAQVLESPDLDEALRTAVRTRLEFAAGEVLRDE